MDAPSDLGSPGAASTPHPPEGPPGPRRLRRRPDDGHIAGVCAGVAEYFDVDPMLVRIAAVVLAFSGPGVIAYILAWIFVPADPGPARFGEPRPPVDRTDRATQIFGIVLLGLGVSVIWGDWWSPLKGWLFPLGLIALGGWLLLRPDRDDPLPPVPPVPPVPPGPPGSTTTPWRGMAAPSATEAAPPPPGEAGAVTVEAEPPEVAPPSADPTTDLPVPEAPPTDPGDPADGGGAGETTTVLPTTAAGFDGSGGGWDPPPAAPWDVPPAPVPGAGPLPERRRERNHRHRHLVGPGVFGVLLIWTGIAWLTGVGLTTGLAVGLVILGLGFVLGSFVGGSRALIFPALLVAVALAISAVIDIPLSGPVGQQHWSPDSLAELEDVYEVSMGEGTLDLTGLDRLGSDTTVRATVGLGHLVVLVRPDQDLLVDTETGAGDVVVLGEEQNGLGFETHEAYHGEGATLTLDLEVGMGQIEVRYGISRDRGDRVDPPDPAEGPDPTTPSTLG